MFKQSALITVLLVMSVAFSSMAEAGNKALPSVTENIKCKSSNSLEALINCILNKQIASQRVKKKTLTGYSENNRRTVFHF